MTNEEAINVLRNTAWLGTENDRERVEKAVELAVKALTAQFADGCSGCAFESTEEWEMPCCKCKHNSKDYWRKAE